MSWQLQEAKQRFSELVRRALDEGPQVVTRHDPDMAPVELPDDARSRLHLDSRSVLLYPNVGDSQPNASIADSSE